MFFGGRIREKWCFVSVFGGEFGNRVFFFKIFSSFSFSLADSHIQVFILSSLHPSLSFYRSFPPDSSYFSTYISLSICLLNCLSACLYIYPSLPCSLHTHTSTPSIKITLIITTIIRPAYESRSVALCSLNLHWTRANETNLHFLHGALKRGKNSNASTRGQCIIALTLDITRSCIWNCTRRAIIRIKLYFAKFRCDFQLGESQQRYARLNNTCDCSKI